MALIKCPECGKEISDKAISCPGCGAPSKKAETNRYQLSVPQYEYKSKSGSYLRFSGYALWVVGGIASIVLSLEYRYRTIRGFNFWMFLLLAAAFFVAGLIPICFAQFFDDVHTIRCTLQGMQLTSAIVGNHENAVELGKVQRISVAEQEPKNGQKICPECGAILNARTPKCPKCGYDDRVDW